MDSTLLIVLVIIVAAMLANNFKTMKRISKNKEYISCYQAMMDKDDDAYERIVNYMNVATDEEFKNKARIFKLFFDLENNNYLDELNKLDFHDLYYTNNKVDLKKIELNSESALRLVNLMAKANKEGHKDAIEILFNKFNENSSILNSYVEYNVVKNAYNIFMNNNEGHEFLKSLLNGEYDGYRYDRATIGVTKRTASSLLAYANEDIGDFEADVKEFKRTKFGKNLLENLGILERFEDKEEIEEELIEEENKEEAKEEEKI